MSRLTVAEFLSAPMHHIGSLSVVDFLSVLAVLVLFMSVLIMMIIGIKRSHEEYETAKAARDILCDKYNSLIERKIRDE